MKKIPKTLSEGIVDKFISNIFDNIKNNQRARNQRALKTDPQLKKAEENLADAYEKLFAAAKKRGHLPG